MKKSIPFLALLFFFIFACNKGPESPTVHDQSSIGTVQNTPTTASDRDICCAHLVISSTYFNGMTICGVTGAGTACSVSSSCGKTCGVEKVIPSGNKNSDFCFYTECPLCFTNNGALPIQIYLVCGLGTTAPINIPAMTTVCYMIDCNGNLQLC